MAYYINLWAQRKEIQTHIYLKYSEAQSLIDLEYSSAVKIQSWFRGIRLRIYLSIISAKALSIQTQWRRFQARIYYRKLVSLALLQKRAAYYNHQATFIQKVWRGYYVRKYIHNFYARQLYLDGVVTNNNILMESLYDYEDAVQYNESMRISDRDKNTLLSLAACHHYMLSTHQSQGVYSKLSCTHTENTLETVMRSLKSREIEQICAKHKTGPLNNDNNTSYSTSSNNRKGDITLPDINSHKKPQGPFKTLAEVITLRRKPLNPTLRVATDFESSEKMRALNISQELTKIVIDEKFFPFSRVRHAYVPKIHTNSSYSKHSYGNEHFREDDARDRDGKKRFETVLPPISLFDNVVNTHH